jgi:osmotically-inducible protein OsmY
LTILDPPQSVGHPTESCFEKKGIAMTDRETILREVKRAFESDVGLNLLKRPISVGFDDGTLTLDGEVESVAAKKRALKRAALAPGVVGIIDRLRVEPAERMNDAEIQDHLHRAFLSEASFNGFAIHGYHAGRAVVLEAPSDRGSGKLFIEVRDGVVTLNGEVPSLEHKRLAGVLAWWIPGSRDVVNGIAVEPPEEDGPDKIEEAVRVALEKDPFLDATQVRVGVRNRIVRLTGALASDEQRHMAECDAWYVFAVDDVINDIEIVPSRSVRGQP